MAAKQGAPRDMWLGVTLACLVFFLLFLVYPLAKVLYDSVIDPSTGAFTTASFSKFFLKPYYYNALLNSFKVTVLVTVIAALIGTPLAYLMNAVTIRGRETLNILIIISTLSPPFIGAYSWIVLLGRNGVITKALDAALGVKLDGIYGFAGILAVFSVGLFPLIYLYVSGALKNMDNSLNEAAESLGCTGARRVVKVVVPLIMPTLLAGMLLVFMRALADFGTPMLIGEGYRVMPVLIFNEFISEMGGDSSFAAALSIIIVIVTTVIFWTQKYISTKKSFAMNATRPMEAKKIGGWKNIAAHAFAYCVVFIAILPQIVVIYTSFLNTSGRIFVPGYSLGSYTAAFGMMGNAIANTYGFSFIAILAVVILGLAISYVIIRRGSKLTDSLDTLTMMPYIIPGSVMGIALLLAFNKEPLLLSGSAFIIIIAWTIRRLPYTIRSSSAILTQISPSIEEAAISLGASNFKTFVKVTAPMMMPGVVSGAILSWMTIISELSASVILYVGSTRTLTIAIYTEVMRGNYGVAAALSTILTATTLLALLLFFKVSGKRELHM